MLYAIAFGLFAVTVYLFVLFILKRDRGHKEPAAAIFTAMGFGLLAVFMAGFIEAVVLPESVSEVIAGGVQLSMPQLIGYALVIGLVEEAAKILPLALFLYRKRYFDELTDGVIYFGVAALTFGIAEDILYTLEYGGSVGIIRILLSPYVHAGFTILFGVALAQRKVLRKSWWLVVAGFGAAVMAHALYDTLAFSVDMFSRFGLIGFAVVLNALLFVLFRRAQRGDELRGQSTVGINKFCRHCGKPNPQRTLHCAYCGKLS